MNEHLCTTLQLPMEKNTHRFHSYDDGYITHLPLIYFMYNL